MARLKDPDVRAFLESLQTIHSVHRLTAFCDDVIPELAKLIPADFIGYRAMRPLEAISRGRYWPLDAPQPPDEQIWKQHMHEHPVLTHHSRTGDGRASKISDFLTQRQFHQLGLYCDVYRAIGVEDVLAIHLPVSAPGGLGVSYHRHKPTFSERDRLMADLLRPHLVQAYLNAKAIEEMQAALAWSDEVLDTLNQGMILLTPEGRIRRSTPKARRWVAEYFGCSIGGGRLPDRLHRWLRSQEARPASTADIAVPREPLVIEHRAHRLVVRLLSGSERRLLILTQPQNVPLAASLESLGLTRREAEVLAWVREGKTNAEIGVILGTRPRTAAKHLERIYQKLGVETRTAAARLASTVATESA